MITIANNIKIIKAAMPIIIASPDKKVCNQMAIVWGSKPFYITRKDKISTHVIKKLISKNHVEKGDLVVSAYGKQRNLVGGTDSIRLIEV